jgi:putative membrane protein
MQLRRQATREPAGQEPDYRFTLANERTFLAWIRTALALDAAGLAVVQLLPDFGAAGGRKTVGVALLVLGTVIAATSYRRWTRYQHAMRTNTPLPTAAAPRILAAGMAAVGLLALVLLILNGNP